MLLQYASDTADVLYKERRTKQWFCKSPFCFGGVGSCYLEWCGSIRPQ
jgi:hypothetical protein